MTSAEERTCEPRNLNNIYVKLITTESELQPRIKKNKESFLDEIDMLKPNITQQATQINDIKTKNLETDSKLGKMVQNLTVFAEAKDADTKNKLNEIVQNVTVVSRELNTLLTATDGGWSPWSDWTVCPVSCLGGLTIRTRSCTNPVPTTNGQGCVGNDKEVDICNSVMCPDVDDCAQHKCRNGAVCVDELYRYSCNCSAGFTGEYCDADIDECSGQPCQNGATCIDGVASFYCLCVTGYTGTNCETDIDYCLSRPCKNSATCVDGITNYICLCAFGYTGTNCEANINECVSQPCRNGGTCVDGVGAFSCLCVDGYTGTYCETDIDECVSKPCQNEATCVDGVSKYACLCSAGYTGYKCETNIDDCVGNTCSSGSVCVDGVAGYSCVCPTGYTGTYCQTVLPECSKSSSNLHCNCTVECQYAEDEVMCGCKKGYTNEFVTIPNKVLSGYNIIQPIVSGPKECMELCVKTAGCQTCELSRSANQCWINSETPFSQPSVFRDSTNYDFFYRKCSC